jgi:hypothetical protein
MEGCLDERALFRMGALMDAWVAGREDGRMGGRKDGSKEGWVYSRTVRRTDA